MIVSVSSYLGFLESTQGGKQCIHQDYGLIAPSYIYRLTIILSFCTDIFNNFPLPYESSNQNDLAAAKAINIARGVLCGIMFFVYPLESFVARHVVMTNLFGGRDAQ